VRSLHVYKEKDKGGLYLQNHFAFDSTVRHLAVLTSSKDKYYQIFDRKM